ncbi:hypothetical protein E1B28_013043 [Marasmius oreades]|uniref:Uncharacterized protein n=1 Tax=Marasmius oreades TaxID=181124 RepID=A0A9P7ULI7_9AGAR|nr:uncharacterized protein E1B28_013043 [Marasmius oreades]KAG7087062.1 hypothetical protein E1B28_013043 [Marasmius oreades]
MPHKHKSKANVEGKRLLEQLEVIEAMEDAMPRDISPLLDRILQDTFRSVKVEWQDLDGIHWGPDRQELKEHRHRNPTPPEVGSNPEDDTDSDSSYSGSDDAKEPLNPDSPDPETRPSTPSPAAKYIRGQKLVRMSSYSHIDLHDSGKNVPDIPEILFVPGAPVPSNHEGNHHEPDSEEVELEDCSEDIDIWDGRQSRAGLLYPTPVPSSPVILGEPETEFDDLDDEFFVALVERIDEEIKLGEMEDRDSKARRPWESESFLSSEDPEFGGVEDIDELTAKFEEFCFGFSDL